MNTLRKYLDIISESTLLENPWEGKDPAKAQAWAKLSPQVQQKLGMADPTDNIIISRMVKGGFLSGQAVTDANPDGTAKTATPAATPTPAPATRGMAQQPPSAVNPALQPAPLKPPSAGASADGNAGELAAQTPGAVNPALQPAPLKPPSAGASADGNAGELAAQANASAAPAQAGQPVNRDSMTFGQAFADARKNKESTFTWKGKQYGTQLASAKPAATAPAGALPSTDGKGQAGPTKAAAAGQDPSNPLNQPKPNQSGMPTAPVADGNAGEAEARAAMSAPAATTVPPELASVTDKKQPYWVNGTRYEWRNNFSRRAGEPVSGSWTITAQPSDKLQLNATRKKTMAKYTGPDSEFGKQPPAQLAQAVPTQENVGYSEDQNLASIIHLAGLR